MDRVVRQPIMTKPSGDFTGEHRTDTAVGVFDRINEGNLFPVFQCNRRLGNQTVVDRFFKSVILCFTMPFVYAFIDDRIVKETAEIKTGFFPVGNGFCFLQQIDTTDQVFVFPDAELCHDLSHFFCDEEKIIDDIFRLAGKFLSQFRVLCRHPDRTGIQMAFAHHDASLCDQRSCRKTDFIGT